MKSGLQEGREAPIIGSFLRKGSLGRSCGAALSSPWMMCHATDARIYRAITYYNTKGSSAMDQSISSDGTSINPIFNEEGVSGIDARIRDVLYPDYFVRSSSPRW